ncbi:MAG TPA: hypothetical protein VGD67_26845 [Pseudonocardiaceae bacterium]
MTVAAFVVSCLAVAVSVAAAVIAHQQRRIGDRSAAAAEASLREARRASQAAVELAEIEAARRAEELAAAEANRIRFDLQYRTGEQYRLVHLGTQTAYGVKVDTQDQGVLGERVDFDEFPAGDFHDYVLAPTDQVENQPVEVTWHELPDLSDEPQRQLLRF